MPPWEKYQKHGPWEKYQEIRNPAPRTPEAPQGNVMGAVGNELSSIYQGTSPHVEDYKTDLGPMINSDMGPAFADQSGQWQSVQTDKHVIMNLDDGPHVFERSDTTNERILTAGRLFGIGALAPLRAKPTTMVKPPSKMVSLTQDFLSSGVEPRLPLVTQGGAMGRLTGLAAKTMQNIPSGVPITKGAIETEGQIGGAADKIARQFGVPSTPAGAGRILQTGLEDFKGRLGAGAVETPTRKVGFAAKQSSLYDDIPIPKEAPVSLDNTLGALSGISSKFPSNPQFGKTLTPGIFGKWAGLLSPEPELVIKGMSESPIKVGGAKTLTWDELKQFRQFVGEKLRNPPADPTIGSADWKRLYSGISEDMRAIASASPEATKAFSRADAYAKAGYKRINDSLLSVTGSKSAERAYGQILDAARSGKTGDEAKVWAVRRSLSDEDWGDVAATIIDDFGRPLPGQQNVARGQTFSVSTFVTNYEKLSKNAKTALFGWKPGLQESLETLARVASSSKEVERLANMSNTFSQGGLAAAAASLVAAPVATTLFLATNYLGSKALMSPGLVRWFTAVGKTDKFKPATRAAWIQRIAELRYIAKAEPELRDGILQMINDIYSMTAENEAASKGPAPSERPSRTKPASPTNRPSP